MRAATPGRMEKKLKSPSSPKILFFGIYATGAAFPRSNNLMRALRLKGVEVLEAHVEIDGSYQRRSRAVRSVAAAFEFALQLAVSLAVLSWKFLKTPAVDAVIVGHPGYLHIHLARLLCLLTRRHPLLVYDAFIPLYDAMVEDRGLIRPSSLPAGLLHAFEASCLRAADLCLVDTEAHRRYLAGEYGVSLSKIKSVRVGATIRSAFPGPAPAPPDGEFKVVFAGTFIPLQGVDVILEAACLLREHTQISFYIVGSGQLEKAMRALAECRGLSRVTFAGWLPTDRLGQVLRSHHLALGIFGTTPKAARVIPSKVYDICAAGVAFVSADTPAIREVFTHLENAFLVPAGSPRRLAEAILRLRSDHKLRARLAEAAFLTGRTALSLDRTGHQLLTAVKKDDDDPPAPHA